MSDHPAGSQPDANTEEELQLPEVPKVTVTCDAVGRMRIPRTVMSLLLGVGELEDGSKVLVPAVELKIDVTDDSTDETETVCHSISLDNAAFLITSLAQGLGISLEPLKSLVNGQLLPEPARLEQTRHYMLAAQKMLAAGVAEIDEALAATRAERAQGK
ncbi:hypothetical protein [Magnetospirillum sp. UT-4]|uniref:hypothetical protein n=1 Tax=Magnetospirillum sp. UT-4 TaxID=2681467 RepID=UPI0013827F80|nr:hypothetical protein [Magnetospirillum sp. UT-4]CAA7624388.1 hypothetical protein MTBUT4_60040 [Magnetospirillum sp. UT-4]